MKGELNFEQEEYMLESALETYRETREAKGDEGFNNWLSFNITGLQKDFIGALCDKKEFEQFCKECYKQEGEY